MVEAREAREADVRCKITASMKTHSNSTGRKKERLQ